MEADGAPDGIWEASGRSPGSIRELLRSIRQPLRTSGGYCEAAGKPLVGSQEQLGSFRGASGRPMGSTHAINRKAASGSGLSLTSEWAVVLERIAETVPHLAMRSS